MLRRLLTAAVAFVLATSVASAYVEAPHSLGQICKESTNIVLMEVTKVDKTKGLIIFKKVQDLKGKHPADVIKHNIGQRGFAPREWQNVMKWAEEGKKAVFFHNGGASETCIDTYWYQCYPEGEWWGLSHAEPFLLRTFYGEPEKLAGYVQKILNNEEVIVPCLADGDKNQFHERKGKIQSMRASLKRGNYDAKRDFVGFGAPDGEGAVALVEYKSITLMPAGSADWKFLPANQNNKPDWLKPEFDDNAWKSGKAPVGYGEPELQVRKGTLIEEKGQPFLFRRSFEVSKDVLVAKGVIFRVSVASDNSAEVFLNGQPLDKDPTEDHEFAYWNHEIDLEAKQLKEGKNVLAILVKNAANSSDLYLDVEVSAQVPLPPPKPTPKPNDPKPADPKPEEKPGQVVVDKKARTVTVDCQVAPRKLPNLNEVYPIEVIATYPAPKGQKAHETVVTIHGIKPTQIHKGMEEIGLKAGKPAKGEGAKAEGPEVKLYFVVETPDGKVQKIPVETLLVDRKTNQQLPAFTWHFTGSVMKQLDPEKDQKDYAADFSGTLIALFPVTDETVIQTSLTMKEEPLFKLEVVKDKLPKEGTPLKLVIEAK